MKSESINKDYSNVHWDYGFLSYVCTNANTLLS